MSKRYSRMLAGMIERLTAPLHPWRRANTRLLVANALLQTHEIATRHGKLILVSTDPHALEYPRELLSREPETIDWIDGFETPCTYWDIGANVGTYALYAALQPGVSIVAFEPAAASYAALCRNVEANGRAERVQAFCVALNDTTRLGSLNMSGTHAGSVLNSFESTEDCFGKPLDIAFRQSMIGFSIEDFRRLFGVAAPNYLKIDVDGIEQQILDGAGQTLRDPALRSVLIELEDADTIRNDGIVERLVRAGFVMSLRGPGHRGGTANAIFTRPPG
jgi:FkbM family methyltransferase